MPIYHDTTAIAGCVFGKTRQPANRAGGIQQWNNVMTANQKRKTAKDKAAKLAAAKLANVAKAATTTAKPIIKPHRHLTNRYAEYGHGKNELSTKTTDRRYSVDDVVQLGHSTIASIESLYGFSGLRVVARHVRFGRYVVRGFAADALPHLDAKADKKMAEAMIGSNAAIVPQAKKQPTRLCK